MTGEFSITGVAASDRAGLARDATKIRASLKQALDLTRSLPANSAAESRVNDEVVALLTLGVAGYDDYVAGLKTASDALVRDADDRIGRFLLQMGPVRDALFDLYGERNLDPQSEELRKFGGALLVIQPEINRYNRLQSQFIQQLQERPFVLSKARSTAVRARAAARQIATRIESIDPPTDATLLKAQRDYAAGWVLIAKGSGDYIAALDSGDAKLFESGDAKLNQAVKLHERGQRAVLSLASG